MNNEEKKQKQEISVVYKIDDNEIKLTPSIVQKYLVGSKFDIHKILHYSQTSNLKL